MIFLSVISSYGDEHSQLQVIRHGLENLREGNSLKYFNVTDYLCWVTCLINGAGKDSESEIYSKGG